MRNLCSSSLLVLRVHLTSGAGGQRERMVGLELRPTADLAALRTPPGDEAPLRQPESGVPVALLGRWLLRASEFGISANVLRLRSARSSAASVISTGIERMGSLLLAEHRRDQLRAALVPGAGIPPRVGRPLEQLVARELPAGKPLWLEIDARDAGHLADIPWEQLLSPYLRTVPVLRLPYHAINPVHPREAWNVALCLSGGSAAHRPMRAGHVRSMVNSVLGVLPPRSRIHIFADTVYASDVEQLGSTAADAQGRSVVVHAAPPPLSPEAMPASSTAENWDVWEHPWRTWVRNAVEHAAVDVVHWVAPLRGGDLPQMEAMRWPGTPRQRKGNLVRFVPADGVVGFLNDVGAWAGLVSFTNPSAEIPALRIADQMSSLRPSHVFVHNAVADRGGSDVALAYMLLSGSDNVPRLGPSVVGYCHPELTGDMAPPTQSAQPDTLAAYQELTSLTGSILAQPGATPAWVVAAQRVAEQSLSNCLDASTDRTDVEQAEQAAVQEAMRTVQAIIERNMPSQG